MTNRELDAQIAEKVMGWTYWRSKHGHWIVTDPDGKTLEPLFGNLPPKYDPETGKKNPDPFWHDGLSLPDYSTDISAAWQVVEKVLKDHPWDFGFRIETHCENSEEKFHAFFPTITACPPYEEMDPEANIAEADTAPLAICLAALKAVGVSVPGGCSTENKK